MPVGRGLTWEAEVQQLKLENQSALYVSEELQRCFLSFVGFLFFSLRKPQVLFILPLNSGFLQFETRSPVGYSIPEMVTESRYHVMFSVSAVKYRFSKFFFPPKKVLLQTWQNL